MSGPKTDELEVERQRQQRLARARARATELVAGARLALERQLEGLSDICAGLSGGGALMARARAIAGQTVGALKKTCTFDQAPTDDEARRRLEDMERKVKRALGTAARQLDPLRDQAEALARTAQAAEDRAFARILGEEDGGNGLEGLADLLRAAAKQAASAGAGERPRTGSAPASTRATEDPAARATDTAQPSPIARAATPESSPAQPSPAEQAACLRDAVTRAAALAQRRGTCDADRAQLLAHLRALNDAAAGANADVPPAAYGIAAQLALVLPAMERRADELQRLLAQIETLEAELARRSPARAAQVVRNRRAYGDPDAAASYTASLQRAVDQLDTQDYIRACIDEVMAHHGYTVARSVTLGRAGGGTHRVFSGERATEGIHAFVSDEGDMMLEVVGLDADCPLEDGATVAADAPSSILRQDELVAAQHDFCSVYAQIADELAAYGIRAAERHHARPDARFCKELRAAGGAGAAGETEQKAAGHGGRAAARPRRHGGGMAREMK